MDKKDIYEHLAKIYLDASSGKKNKTKIPSKLFKNLFLVSIAFIFCVSLFFYSSFRRPEPLSSEIALVLTPEVLRINFNFDPAKKEILTLNLNKLNLSKYNSLGFAVKKANPKDTISLRVEFVSSFKEKSNIYIKDIPFNWGEYQLNLSDFKGISDWTEMRQLAFTIEEWNTLENKGLIFVDNVRFLK